MPLILLPLISGLVAGGALGFGVGGGISSLRMIGYLAGGFLVLKLLKVIK
jgi:hypothetical protein